MKLPKSWKKVTPLSKTIAFILFILLPFVGFYLGTKYQQSVDSYNWYTQELNTIIPNTKIIDLNMSSNNQTTYVHVGDTVRFTLGTMTWSDPKMSDTTILVPSGVMQYRAVKAGTDTLSMTGRPVCKPHQLCSQLIVAFSTTIVVK